MSTEIAFWTWFQSHEDELFHFERDQEAIFDRLAAALRAVDADLTFEFGPPANGVREFVISAGGIKRAFPAVEKLHKSRPQLNRFQVTAFRPRRPVHYDIEYADARISPKDVYYKLCRDANPQKLGILLFLPGYSQNSHAIFGQIGYLFLDEALGEYDVETKVGFIEMMGHDSKYFDGSSRLHDLATHFDAVLESINGK